jgi:GAF domain-containing protein
VLRAGAGWRTGLVGRATLGTGRESHAGYAIETNEPVIIPDLRTETRFRPPPLLRDHGVVSGLSVLIRDEGAPYGVLGAYTTARKRFTTDHVRREAAKFVDELRRSV